MTAGLPPPSPGLRRLVLVAVAGSAVVLVPWIVYLGATLEGTHRTEHWNLAWVGFDIVLFLALATTALCAWRGRQAVVPLAIVSATLLVVDAWFDVVLDWGTPDATWSVLSAVLAELPLAALLVLGANRVIHVLVGHAWLAAGREGPAPHVRRLRIEELLGLLQGPQATGLRLGDAARAAEEPPPRTP